MQCDLYINSILSKIYNFNAIELGYELYQITYWIISHWKFKNDGIFGCEYLALAHSLTAPN